jgi:hypothetical protein
MVNSADRQGIGQSESPISRLTPAAHRSGSLGDDLIRVTSWLTETKSADVPHRDVEVGVAEVVVADIPVLSSLLENVAIVPA